MNKIKKKKIFLFVPVSILKTITFQQICKITMNQFVPGFSSQNWAPTFVIVIFFIVCNFARRQIAKLFVCLFVFDFFFLFVLFIFVMEVPFR